MEKAGVAMRVSCIRRAFDGDGDDDGVKLECIDCCGNKIPANAQREGEEESNNDAIEKQLIPTPIITM